MNIAVTLMVATLTTAFAFGAIACLNRALDWLTGWWHRRQMRIPYRRINEYRITPKFSVPEDTQ